MMNTYVPVFLGLDVRGGRKLQTDRHTHTHTHGITTVTIIIIKIIHSAEAHSICVHYRSTLSTCAILE